MRHIQLIAGTSCPKLAAKISRLLKIPLTPIEIKRFANGEIYIRIGRKVRGDDVFVIQTLCPPVNDNFMELLIIVDALKRASACRINLVCPHLAYSRQDRKTVSREPISAKLVANLIAHSGADRLATVDLHADQIQGFYDIPLDHLVGYPLLAEYLIRNGFRKRRMVVVSPDIGGVKRAHKIADLLQVPLVIIDKVRPGHNQAQVAHVVGDVKGKTAILVDDIIDTGGSIAEAAQTIKDLGAKKVIIGCTHGLLSNNAAERLQQSCVSQVILLDTVPIGKEKRFPKLKIISVAPLLSRLIKKVHHDMSVGELFTWKNKKRLL